MSYIGTWRGKPVTPSLVTRAGRNSSCRATTDAQYRGIMIVRIQAIDPLRQNAEQQPNGKLDKMDTREKTMKRMMLFQIVS
ncbi:hypothetical protein BCON_0193g00170 [Botryotinia convoluta]|uniref:Uncharacterized protein n=1 Tax=Botryotinia convoluta TaxID=54673 RepID=A0A4Z1HLS5_9HELO|nr:hypothetical protein BCON_0193g00170 [Botryotinia convoluta]